MFEKPFVFGDDNDRIPIKQTDLDGVLTHNFCRQQRERDRQRPLPCFHVGHLRRQSSISPCLLSISAGKKLRGAVQFGAVASDVTGRAGFSMTSYEWDFIGSV